MDIELLNAIATAAEVTVDYTPYSWTTQIANLKDGLQDVASGVTFTEERAAYMLFSLPYRFEVNSLFARRDIADQLRFSNIREMMTQIRLLNFRLAILNGTQYSSSDLNAFIADNNNKDIIIFVEDEAEGLKLVTSGRADGFIADRITAATIIMEAKAGSSIEELPLNLSTPIHMVFSKKTVPIEMVEQFNEAITNLFSTDQYKNIVKNYLYPVLLLQTINTKWFYILGVVGTIAFSISGVVIAFRQNATIFSAIIFAMLPSVGGSVIRDVLLNAEEIGIFLTPSYIYLILIIALIGFACLRMFVKDGSVNTEGESGFTESLCNKIVVMCDALGQATFIVTGVTVALIGRVEPLELWGPFLAFLTANGGCILRDLLTKDRKVLCISDELHAEISVIWGWIFSVFLSITSSNPNQESIKYFVIFVVFGAFFSRLWAHHYKISSLKFRP
jgi:polar amino acid transport system substrate-binding protein